MQEAAQPRIKYRRRTYVVNRRFQFKYTLIITMIGTGIAAALGYFLYISIKESTEIVNATLLEYPQLQEHVQAADQQKYLILILGVAAIALALLVWGVLMTHRVAGPLFIITRYVNTLADGVYPSIRPLRKGDELHDFFEAFAHMMDELKARDRKDLDALGRVCDGLQTQVNALQSGAADTDKTAKEIHMLIEPVRAVMAHKAKRMGVSGDSESKPEKSNAESEDKS